MAKALAFRRDQRKVVTIDTINNAVSDLGGPLPDADLLDRFGLRTRNNVAIFKGDPYVFYRRADDASPHTGHLHLAKFTSGAWTDQPGGDWTPAAGSFLTPTALQVVQDNLVALAQGNAHATLNPVSARVSTDGSTWSAATSLPLVTLPNESRGGHTIVWRNAVWIATSEGLIWYDPLSDTMAAVFDKGDDVGVTGQETLLGSFAFWNGDLYFAMPGTAMRIYKLASDWQLGSPSPAPAWTNQTATGILSLGTVTPGPDVGAVCLFVNAQDDLCLLYSAQLGTKLAQAASSAFPAFTDVIDAVPLALRSVANLGFAVYTDDRRRTAELQSFLIHYPSAGDTQLATWDGTSEMVVRNTFTGVLVMPSHGRFGAVRTYTALQPTTHIRSTSAPFPGRTQLDYTVRDASSRPVDVFGEYSTDGDEWFPMTQGDGDSGAEQLATTPAGVDYSFYWDTWSNLDGNHTNMNMRIVARIAGT